MIGNDIIDLKLAAKQSNWQRQGFLNKIFSDSEQEYIFNSSNPFQMIWLLWSMKESAYKTYLQKYPKRFFNPKKFKCILKSNNQGIVKINDCKFITRSEMTENLIHTIATLKENNIFSMDCFETKNVYKDQHKKTYEKLQAQISKIKGVSKLTLKIKKDNVGVPRVYSKKTILNLSISISHHGNYGAYAILN